MPFPLHNHIAKHLDVAITDSTSDLLPFNSLFSAEVNAVMRVFLCHVIIMFSNKLVTVYSMHDFAPSNPLLKQTPSIVVFHVPSDTRRSCNLHGIGSPLWTVV